ncbi:MAG: hypothetical protein NTNFB02_29100 [Nitrospira sp.]
MDEDSSSSVAAYMRMRASRKMRNDAVLLPMASAEDVSVGWRTEIGQSFTVGRAVVSR